MERGTSYFGVRDPRHAERDLDRFADRGLDAVLHTFSERDRRYYRETMADLVASSHDRGQRVYVNPWGVGRVFGGEALSEFIGRHPDSRQRLSTGDRVPAACFNDPEFRKFMREWARDAVELGADVVFWDEPHWYVRAPDDDPVPDSAWTCRCEACRERFEDEYGEQMPETETDRVVRFKEDSLFGFLDEMMALVREEGAENAVCLLPGDRAVHGLTDWERLAESDHIDVFATDPYWHVFEEEMEPFVREYTDRVVELAETNDLESQIWIQGFALPDDAEAIEAVRQATRIAVEGGVDSVFMWGWDACRVISSIAVGDPEAVWEAYLDELPDE
jgi:sugar phosphate isomerase/epimerase